MLKSPLRGVQARRAQSELLSGASGGTPVSSFKWYGVGGWDPRVPNPAEPGFDTATVTAAYQPHWGTGTIFARVDAPNKTNSFVNIHNPGTYDATELAAVSFDSTSGWSNGGTGYLNVGFIGGSFWQIFVSFSNAVISGNQVVYGNRSGVSGDNGSVYFSSYNSGTQQLYMYDTRFALAPALASGIASVGRQCYLNGSPVGSLLEATPFLNASYPLYICAENYIGTPVIHAGVTVHSWIAYNVSVTDAQAENITWGMQVIQGDIVP